MWWAWWVWGGADYGGNGDLDACGVVVALP